MVGSEAAATLAIYYDKIMNVLQGFDSRKADIYDSSFATRIKVQQSQELTAKTLPLIENILLAAMEYADTQKTVFSNFRANAFHLPDENLHIRQMKIQEIRGRLLKLNNSEISEKFFKGSDLVAYAILTDPLEMLPKDILEAGVKARLGDSIVAMETDATDVLATLHDWFIKAYQFLGAVPDHKTENLKL